MITVNTLRKMKAEGEKIAMLTAYESSFAALMDKAGVDVLLVGDSLGMTVQGRKSTLPVSLRDMCYHTENVARGTEGGVWMAETTEFLQMRGIPVCAHIGLTPQSVFAFGGYKVQGRGDKAEALLHDAEAHDAAGAAIVLMECVPAALAKRVTEAVSCPTIGIGAGADCDGQVLVMHDMLGVFPGKTAKFVKNFMAGRSSIQEAVGSYVAEVKAKTFPAAEHIFEE